MPEEQKKKNTLTVKNPLYAEQKPKKIMKPREQLWKEPEFSMMEGSVVLYNFSDKGGLTRIHEVDMKMGRKYLVSKNGNMMFTRSKNKKIFSITSFDYLEKK